jgi:hypothetical protein
MVEIRLLGRRWYRGRAALRGLRSQSGRLPAFRPSGGTGAEARLLLSATRRFSALPRRCPSPFDEPKPPHGNTDSKPHVRGPKSEGRRLAPSSEVHGLPVYCQALFLGVHRMWGCCVKPLPARVFGHYGQEAYADRSLRVRLSRDCSFGLSGGLRNSSNLLPSR